MRGARVFMVDVGVKECPEKIKAEARSVIRMLTDEETTKLAEAALYVALNGARTPLSMYGAIGMRICEHANIVLWPKRDGIQKGDHQ